MKKSLALLTAFNNAKAHPTYVGLTFGGNCANAHGLQTKKGEAQFRVVNIGVY